VYARHARNVNEHGIDAVVQEWDANFRVDRPINPTMFMWNPWSRDLKPVTDRGVAYRPPTSHLGRDLTKSEQTPLGVTSLTIKYYMAVYNTTLTDIFGATLTGSEDLLEVAGGSEKKDQAKA
jgi:hypothetical protein